MNFLKSLLPAPVVDLGLLLLVVFGIYLAFKKGIEKLKESGHWDRFLEKLPEPNSSSFGASSGRSSDSRKRAT